LTTDAGPSPRTPARAGVVLRQALEADLPACGSIWRTALNDYMGRLNLPEIPDDLTGIGKFHGHLLATSPAGFWIAERVEGGATQPVGFVSAVRRDRLWFLSMLFVMPDAQGRGIGRLLLDQVLPAERERFVLATATDSAQPISNALYATYGIVPRLPLLDLIGRPTRQAALPALPSGVRPVPFSDLAAGSDSDVGRARLLEELNAIDAEVVGFEHPQDHRMLMAERHGFLYLGPDGSPLAYGYASDPGRVAPVAARDAALLAPVVGHLLAGLEPRGASAVRLPGGADRAIVALLRAGLRIEGLPVLLCWNRPFADFERYVPISPGLL
jgi:GNAT superfamily N-acetyltransferase